jgi:hypothetical protein
MAVGQDFASFLHMLRVILHLLLPHYYYCCYYYCCNCCHFPSYMCVHADWRCSVVKLSIPRHTQQHHYSCIQSFTSLPWLLNRIDICGLLGLFSYITALILHFLNSIFITLIYYYYYIYLHVFLYRIGLPSTIYVVLFLSTYLVL